MAFNCPYKWYVLQFFFCLSPISGKNAINVFSFLQRFHADLLAGLQAFRDMSRASHASVPRTAVEEMLGYVIYGGHVINGLDLNAVKSIASSVFVDSVGMVSVSSFRSFQCSCFVISASFCFFVHFFLSCDFPRIQRKKTSSSSRLTLSLPICQRRLHASSLLLRTLLMPFTSPNSAGMGRVSADPGSAFVKSFRLTQWEEFRCSWVQVPS